ncbi:MAG: hypothetical protein ACYCUW_02865 [bacterium]
MRKNYQQKITKRNIGYYYFLSFIFFGYILSVISIYAYPAAISSLVGIFAIALIAFGISVYIFNFTGLKKLLDAEIKQDIEKYEEKIQRKEGQEEKNKS